MLNKHLILGVFDDEDKLMNAVVKVQKKGFRIFDCFTPFPVHNLDKEMGIHRSNLTVGAFIAGALGFTGGLLLQCYIMVFDWPMIIGGKPMSHRMLPSMVPATFECTILFTAFGIGLMFFARSKMIHGIKADILDLRQTDDRMLIGFEGDTKDLDRGQLQAILEEEGALEIRERINGEQTVLPAGGGTQTKVPPKENRTEQTVANDNSEALLEKVGRMERRDDLKQINGIGPAYEKKLNEIGIVSFEQIARLDRESIAILEDITGFQGRVERDQWIEQAKQLINSRE